MDLYGCKEQDLTSTQVSSWIRVLGCLGQLAVGFPMLNIPEQASTPCIVDNFDKLYRFI